VTIFKKIAVNLQIDLNKIYLVLAFALGVSITISTALTNIFAVSLLLLFCFSGEYSPKLTLLKKFYIWPPMALILLSIISSLYTLVDFSETLNWISKMYKLSLIWVIAYICWRNHTTIKPLLIAFFTGVLLNLVAIYLNYYFLSTANVITFSSPSLPAAQSHFVTGFIFAVTSFMLFSTAITVPNWKFKICCITLGLITIIAELGINTSRTGYLIEISVLIIGFFMKFRFKGLVAAVIILPTILITFYQISPNFKARTNQAYYDTMGYFSGTATKGSAGLRLGFYNTAAGIFIYEPWRLLYGCGTGAQGQCSREFIEKEIAPQNKKYYHSINNPHNQYAYFVMQSGIWALGIFVFWLIALFYYAKELPIIMRNNARILLIAFAVGCFVNSWMLDIGPGFIFCYLIPILFAQKPKQVNTEDGCT